MADFDNRNIIIALAGATASGKTALGVELALALGGEVISCDSMQVYRGMGIACATPTASEMKGVPHHLVNYVDPCEEYSVARFCSDATEAVTDIFARGKVPLLVGGTGLYMQSFTDNITFAGGGASEYREKLSARVETEGAQCLLHELSEIDPEYAAKLHVNDIKRIVRALEMYYSSGIRMSDQLAQSRSIAPSFDTVRLAIGYRDREVLYSRINKRVDIMLENGLLEEAREAYVRRGVTSAQAIGHKELFAFFDGTATQAECAERLKMQTRRYAKRQLSWFRRDGRFHWLYADGKDLSELTNEALDYIEEETCLERHI